MSLFGTGRKFTTLFRNHERAVFVYARYLQRFFYLQICPPFIHTAVDLTAFIVQDSNATTKPTVLLICPFIRYETKKWLPSHPRISHIKLNDPALILIYFINFALKVLKYL